MAAPVVDAATLDVILAADSKRHSNPSRWADISPFNVSVAGDGTPQFRVRDPGGTWAAWRSADLSVDGAFLGSISVPNLLGSAPLTVVDSAAVELTTQGHQIQFRVTTRADAGLTRNVDITIAGFTTRWTATNASAALGYPWDPETLPPDPVVLRIAPPGSSHGGQYTYIDTVTQAVMDAGGYNVVMVRGGTGATDLWAKLDFRGLTGPSNTERYFVINDTSSDGPVTIRQPVTGGTNAHMTVRTCENVTFDFRHKWNGATSDALTYGLVADALLRDDVSIHNNGIGVHIKANSAVAGVLAKNLSFYGIDVAGRAVDGQGPGMQAGIRLGDGEAGRLVSWGGDTVEHPLEAVIDNILFRHCRAQNTTIEPFYIGLNWDANSGNLYNNPAKDLTVRDCISIRSGSDGITLKSVVLGTAEVSSSYICGTGRGDQTDAGQSGGVYFFNCPVPIICHSNFILESGGIAVKIGQQGSNFTPDFPVTPYGTAEIYNNVIVRPGQTHDSGVGDGVATGGSARTYNVYNNTIVDTERHGIRNNGGSAVVNAWNNIVVGVGGTAISGTITASDNYTGTTASVAFVDHDNATVEDRDYHLTASTPDGTILNHPTATGFPDEDKDGNARPFGDYSDLGAYELQEAPA